VQAGRLGEFVAETEAVLDRAERVGVVGSRAADRIVGQPCQAVDRLQRLDEGGAAGERAIGVVNTGYACKPERAARRGTGISITVAKALKGSELRLGRQGRGCQYYYGRERRHHGGAKRDSP
jgi:hypothetical protein